MSHAPGQVVGAHCVAQLLTALPACCHTLAPAGRSLDAEPA
ncbi:hypothetical protein ABZ896_03620 [Streptomyces sp. NPDC047072]